MIKVVANLTKNKMKNTFYGIGVIILLILIAGIIKFNLINNNVHVTNEKGNHINNQEKKLEIKNNNSFKEKTENGDIQKSSANIDDVKISIISPDEKEFYSGDSQIWEVKIDNFDRRKNRGYQCYWTWYINGEKKWYDLKGCKSTRTIPFNPGNMKVEVRIEFTETDYSSGKKQIEILDTKTETRNYILLSK